MPPLYSVVVAHWSCFVFINRYGVGWVCLLAGTALITGRATTEMLIHPSYPCWLLVIVSCISNLLMSL